LDVLPSLCGENAFMELPGELAGRNCLKDEKEPEKFGGTVADEGPNADPRRRQPPSDLRNHEGNYVKYE
jgi:hypothetical protein